MKKIYQKSVVVFDGFMIPEICEHSVRKEWRKSDEKGTVICDVGIKMVLKGIWYYNLGS